MEEDKQQKQLSSSQKTGFVLLFVFALLTVGLSFLQVRNNIYNPFALKISQSDVEAMQSLQYDENAKLQQIDTDQDGINDYEEINFYNTSRYLPDTDSDGLSDREEIDNGTDPVCPEGKKCSQEEFATASSSEANISPLLSSIQTPEDILLNSQISGLSNTNTSSTSDIDLSSVINDPIALRKMLIESGKVTEADLKGVDDATLLKMAQDSFGQLKTVPANTNIGQQ